MSESVVKYIKRKKMNIIITFIVFLWSLIAENMLLQTDKIQSWQQITFYWICKLALIIGTFLVVSFIRMFIKKIRMHDKAAKAASISILILGLIYACIFVITFPGYFTYDPLYLVHHSILCDLYMLTQGLWTCMLYYISLSIIPFVSGVIAVQIIIELAIVGYLIYRLYSNIKIDKYKKLSYLVLLPNMLPNIILGNIFPLRAALYGHLWVLLLFELIMIWKYKEKITHNKIIFLSIISAIISSWRVEGIFCCLMCVSLLIILIRKEKSYHQKLLIYAIILPIILTMGSSFINNKLVTQKNTEMAIRQMMITTLSVLLQEDLRGDNLDKNIEKINKVIDLDIVKQHKDYWSPTAWYYGANNVVYTKHDLRNAELAYIDLVRSNFIPYIKMKLQMIYVANYSWAFIPPSEYTAEQFKDFISPSIENEWDLYKPLFPEIRSGFFEKMSELRLNKNLPIKGSYISTYIIIIIFMISLIRIKKLYFLFIISGSCLAYEILLITGMAMSWIMYFIPIIYIGWQMGIICFINLIENIEHRNK